MFYSLLSIFVSMCDDDLDSILSLISTKINKIFCDREFVGCVREDLDVVLKDDKYCVLFPKLKPIFLKVLRYQAFIFDLSVFCIGSGPNQVAVVCKKITKEPTDECPSVSTQKVSKRMDTEENTSKSVTKKSRMRPTQSYYVPPAQRSVSKKSKDKDVTKESKKSSGKGTSKKSNKALEIEQLNTSNDVNVCSESVYSSQVVDSSIISNESESGCFEDQFSSELSQIENEQLVHDNDNSGQDLPSDQLSTCATLVNENPVVQNLDNIVESDCIPSDDSFILEPSAVDDKNETNDEIFNKILTEDEATLMENVEKTVEEASSPENIKVDDTILSEETSKVDFDVSSSQTQSDEIVPKESEIETNFSDLYISYDDEMKKKSADCDTDNEKEEMKRALENINRKRRPLIKNIHNDDTLWIGESNVTPQRTNYSENEKNNISKDNARVSTQEDKNNLSNWEDMFDENGDLHAEYIGEIVKQIGCEVKVVKASHDYSDYQNTKYQDLEHVIELYDFPSTFKTQDIMQLYRGASQNPMYVKWCDDTHCLLVLSTPAQAQRALKIEHDIIKSRPLALASSIAATTASGGDLKPAMKRPQTNMQTARRLITTHLGTKSTLSKEEVEQERQALREAREQRRLERQNEKDAWEGRPRNTKS